mgnify:CR=1 FL=1
MRLGEQLAVHINPLMLRLVVGVTFLVAGLGKLNTTMEVQGQRAATLANMGVNLPASSSAAGQGPAQTDADADAGGSETDEGTSSRATPDPADGAMLRADWQPDQAVQPDPETEPESETQPESEAQPEQTAAEGEGDGSNTAAPAPRFSAEDFPEPAEVRSLYGIALMLHGAANPGTDADGSPLPAIAPAWAAQGSRPKALAWAVALTETVFGGLLILGLLARLGGFALAGTMLGAIWLTEFGPAWQTGAMTGFFGVNFLPDHPPYDLTSPNGWQTLLWQTLLLVSSLAVLFGGSGALGLDRLLFGRRAGSHLDDDEGRLEDDDD